MDEHENLERQWDIDAERMNEMYHELLHSIPSGEHHHSPVVEGASSQVSEQIMNDATRYIAKGMSPSDALHGLIYAQLMTFFYLGYDMRGAGHEIGFCKCGKGFQKADPEDVQQSELFQRIMKVVRDVIPEEANGNDTPPPAPGMYL
jgi:hypothetical protein